MVKWGRKKKQEVVVVTAGLSFEQLHTAQTIAVAALAHTPGKSNLKQSPASDALGPPPLPNQHKHHHHHLFGHKGAAASARQPIERWIAWAAQEAGESVCSGVQTVFEAIDRANSRLAQLPHGDVLSPTHTLCFHPDTQQTHGEYEDAMRAEVPGLVCKCTEAYNPTITTSTSTNIGTSTSTGGVAELSLVPGDLVVVLRQADPPTRKPTSKSRVDSTEPVLYIPHEKGVFFHGVCYGVQGIFPGSAVVSVPPATPIPKGEGVV
jgi:hypothetical protein